MSSHLIFMIESGKMLDLVKHHIKEVRRVRNQSLSLMRELGVDECWQSERNGVVRRVHFGSKPRHPDFTIPKTGSSHPKRGTEWAKRFDMQVGYESPCDAIAEALNVPLSISYRSADGKGHGSRRFGIPLQECGFLYLSEKGPYALYVPDVEAEVASDIAKGYIVAEPAASFKPEFEGCRRITEAEWDFIVAEHNLKVEKAKSKRNAA